MLYDRIHENYHPTCFQPMTADQVIPCNQRNDWYFNWLGLFSEGYAVQGLTLRGSPAIQGLVSLQPSPDHGAIVIDLVESAPLNRGRQGRYDHVAENLFAFAGQLSLELGFEGYVFFTAKTGLIDYYLELGARIVRNRDLVFTPSATRHLIQQFLGGEDLC